MRGRRRQGRNSRHAAADASAYQITQVGLSRNVQWLQRAGDDSLWLILATKRAASDAFLVLGCLDVTGFPPQSVGVYFAATLGQASGPTVKFAPAATPLKRKQEVLSQGQASK